MGRFQSLSAADLDEAGATLTVRDWFNGPRERIERARWCFARDVDGVPVPDPDTSGSKAGSRARRYYEVTYTTGRARSPAPAWPRSGTRGVLSAFDHGVRPGSEHRDLPEWALAAAVRLRHGKQRRGRIARLRRGVLPHRRRSAGEFNNRSAQPSTMNSLGFAYLPPFSPEDGLLAPARDGATPRSPFSPTRPPNTGEAMRRLCTPMPRAGTSLTPTTGGPICMPVCSTRPECPRSSPPCSRSNSASTGSRPGRRPGPPGGSRRVGGGRPAAAAERGAESRRTVRPGRADILRELAGGARFAGIVWPDPAALLGVPPIDLGPEAAEGVARYPAVVTGPPRPCLVAAVDEDGNETCGVRLPDVAVPLAASFGWNPEVPRPDPADPGRPCRWSSGTSSAAACSSVPRRSSTAMATGTATSGWCRSASPTWSPAGTSWMRTPAMSSSTLRPGGTGS